MDSDAEHAAIFMSQSKLRCTALKQFVDELKQERARSAEVL